MSLQPEQTPFLLEKGDSEITPSPRERTNNATRLTKLALLAVLLLGNVAVWMKLRYSLERSRYVHVTDNEGETIGMCRNTDPVPIKAPRKNVWKNLSVKEATDIRAWLWESERGLNLTLSNLAADNDNSVFLIEAFQPPKAPTLAYLNGSAPAPERYAHAVIHHGNEEKIVDYLVGPLPLSSDTKLVQLRDIYHNPDIPYNARGLNRNSTCLGHLLADTFGPIADITMDLFGGVALGHANDTIIAGGNAPLSYDGTWRRMWLNMKLNVPGNFLYPLDFYVYFDLTGTDPSKWHLLRLVYAHQVFASIADFRKAYEDGTLKRSQKTIVGEPDTWATRSREGKGSPRDLDDRAGPRSVSFNGLRFRVDHDEQYVTWMGYSFYLGFERDMGLNLWDINFRGERIIYEISPQEAMAQYSGTDAHQATTVFLDRAFGMGEQVKELMVGYDCPAEAVYLPVSVHTAAGSSTRLNAVCIFEKDSTKPLSRHTAWLKDEMGAVKGYELTVRSISTVGSLKSVRTNHEFDYTFQLDGSIELRVSASGYLQGGYWDETERNYGHKIRDTTMGSLHDHVINFKVDFDIAGTRNSLKALSLEMEEVSAPWADPDWGEQYVHTRQIKSEDESRLEYFKNMQGTYVVTNEEELNAWGHPRGYAIHPGVSAIHLTNLDCKRTENNVNWAKHSLSITQRHDNEPYASSAWNIHLPGKPTVDFYRFFNGESLEQEDVSGNKGSRLKGFTNQQLVMWLSLGTHHIPRAEDSPQTLTNVASTAVMLIPFNYNDYDVSMEAMNAVILNAPHPGKPWAIDENGVEQPFCVPAPLSPFSYNGLISYDEQGSLMGAQSILEQRKINEAWHGIHAEM